ncbi:uncharacterized protein LOC135684609 [Rhopilema esculentum]|uniref:uncharacterized protein LOC135684609 n=1 Tax=Rhopilema esculentum TaxID=499914 RepID=UPI0031DBE345
MLYTGDSTLSYTKDILKHCPMRQESLEEARKRIFAEKLRKPSTKAPSTQHQNEMIRNAKRADGKPTKQVSQESKSHAKLAAENNKDLIAWITSGVVSGTIVLMIMTACAIHYFKFKYENIFVARMHEQENMQEQQQSLSSMQMFPKQQAVVFLPEKQVTKVVNL